MIIIIAAILFGGLVGVILVGARLRRLIPAEHLSTDSKDAVKLALGLVATMTAILLGLLVSSAKNSFDTARSEVIQMSAKIALLDRILVLYGKQTDDAQRALKAEAVTLMIQLAELRSLVQAQAVSSLSRPLLVALVIWLVVIFLGFAILAPPNTTSTLALLAGAFSVGCAVFIILELDYP